MGLIIGSILFAAIWFILLKGLFSKIFKKKSTIGSLAKKMNEKVVQVSLEKVDPLEVGHLKDQKEKIKSLHLESVYKERELAKQQKIKNKIYKALHKLADSEAKARLKEVPPFLVNQNREDGIDQSLSELAKLKILGRNEKSTKKKDKENLIQELQTEIANLKDDFYNKTSTKYKAGLRLQEAAKKLKINEFSLILPKDPVLDTGDEARLNGYKANISIDNDRVSKFLYVAKVKSGINEKRYTLIGVSDQKNIEDLFKGNDVVSLVEVHRSVEFNSSFALVLQYNMIRKYRPANYFVEIEFNEFERFDGYIDIVPMSHTTQICKRIDYISDNYNEAYSTFQQVSSKGEDSDVLNENSYEDYISKLNLKTKNKPLDPAMVAKKRQFLKDKRKKILRRNN